MRNKREIREKLIRVKILGRNDIRIVSARVNKETKKETEERQIMINRKRKTNDKYK